ncbi:MAG: hypothetical protein HOM55_02435 [Proteobacteria bacterium]|jgi:hypothetical protein|nr:hypothetical protein [Pseudomonadota bacterium]
MNRVAIKIIGLLIGLSVSFPSSAETSSFNTKLSNSYYYTDHHEIVIDRSAEEVWKHVINLGSWMYDLAMVHESGPTNGEGEVREGEVLRLYEGQDYFFEVSKMVYGRLLVGINLPVTTPEGEITEGLAMITLTESNGKTEVSVFMNRKYSWPHESPNPARDTRESEEFASSRRDTFRRFLVRLRDLSEGQYR